MNRLRQASRLAVEPLECRLLFAAQFDAIADADVQRLTANSSFADANFGADSNLRISNDADNTREIYVTFDISSLTSVGSAVVELFGGQTNLADGDNSIGIFAVPTTNWVEGNGTVPPDESGAGLNLDDTPSGEIRWNNRPSHSGGDLSTVLVGIPQAYQWDVTDYLQARKAAGASLVSFKFIATSGAGLLTFSSRESGTAPVLVVEDDTTAPTATASSSNVTTSGGTSQTISVTYADNAGIDPSTIGTSDITVTGPGGALTVTSVSVNSSNPKSVVATYTVTAAGGTWDGGDNGTYTIAVNNGEVGDFGGSFATGGGSFTVAIPVDTTPPIVANFNAQAITSGGGTNYTFTVTYTDDVAINVNTIGTSDVAVFKVGGDGGNLTVTNVTRSGSGGTVNATYTVSAPGGSWTAADNGTYAVIVGGGLVADTNGNNIATANTTFQVAIPDTGAPTVVITPVSTITTAGLAGTQITVTYTDNQLVDASSIDSNDVTVVRDGGGPLTVTLLSKSSSANASSIVAVYSVAAPGGFWNSDDTGSYTITVLAGAVKDTSNNTTSLAGDSFEVNIPSTTPVTDPTFNGGVPVSTGFVAEAVATDTTGRILVAGRQGDRTAGNSQSVLQRLNSDGTLDTFWGEGGNIIALPTDNDGFMAVAVAEKQRVLAAGYRGGDLEIVRYDSKGRLDRKFGTRGVVVADWGGTDDTIHALLALPGGAVLVAGTSGGSFAFAKFNAKGQIDASFGNAGAVLIKPDNDNCTVGALSLLSDGSIVAAGSKASSVVVLRLDGAGSIVTGFGTNGILTATGLGVRSDLGVQDPSIGLAVDRTSRIYVGSRTTGGDMGVRRYGVDGSIDTTFSTDGIDSVDMGGSDDVDFVGVQGSGQIVLVGTTDSGVPGGGTRKLAVAVLQSDGGLAGAFSAGGKFTDDSAVTANPGTTGPFVLHAAGMMQSDGKVLITLADANAAPTSSPLRRLVTPGSGILGQFGLVNGKSAKLSFLDADGSKVSLSLKGGGTGLALWDGTILDLIVSGTGAKSSLGISAKGGNGRVVLRDLRTDGSLKGFSGKTTDVVGTFYVAGDASKLTIGTLSGTVAAAAGIASLAVSGTMAGGYVLSGVTFGSDGKLGGTGTAADTYASGSIRKISVSGAVTASFFGGGVDPVNGSFGDSDDRAPGGIASLLGSISVKRSVDASTVFAAGAFIGSYKLPGKVDPASDARFRVLPT